jgi:Lon protease-like protein
MANRFEKADPPRELPIFPLPMVLLPYEHVPLHIFEPRYRTMLEDIEQGGNAFGLSYFDPKDAAAERPPEGTAGCVAEILGKQPLPDGRSNIMAAGIARYEIVEYLDLGHPYLTAKVRYFEDADLTDPSIEPLADEVLELFRRVANAAFDLSGNRGKLPDIEKTTPEHLSFLVAAVFNLEPDTKYQILAMRSCTQRLEKLRRYLNKAVVKMEENAKIHKAAAGNGHSRKKVDL